MNNPNGTLQDEKILTAADKALNMYCLSKGECLNLLQNAITSKYKKTHKRIAANINKGVKHAREANNIDRIEINGKSNSFITLKNHKNKLFNLSNYKITNTAKN